MSYFSSHNHTHYSNTRLLDCINKPQDLLERSIELGLRGMAITEHESLSSHIEFVQHYKKLKEKGKIPENFVMALGNEPYLVDELVMNQRYFHWILISKNQEGHRVLRKLSSQAWDNSYHDRGMERVPITKAQVEQIMEENNGKGKLISTSACIGGELGLTILKMEDSIKMGVGEDVIAGFKQQIVDYILWQQRVFGEENFFIEVAPNDAEDQRVVNRWLKKIASGMNVPMIYATDSHYLNKDDRTIHKAFLNSKDGEREVDDFYATAYMMSEDEVWEFLQLDFTKEEFDTMTANTNKIADTIEEYDLYKPQIIPEVPIPDTPFMFELPDKYTFVKNMGMSEHLVDRYWAKSCVDELKSKHHLDFNTYMLRLDEEAKELWGISERLGIRMTSYYITMKKIIEIVWDAGDSLVGPARGSATGFLSCYLLGITQMDPIQWNLPHWRHISETRPELPDIDFDTQALRRVQILKSVKDFFGHDKVLNIATFGTEGPKSAVLTACRGLGIDHDFGLYLTSMIPQERGFTWSLKDVLFGDASKGRKPIYVFKNEAEQYENLIEVMLKIEGLISKRGVHAAGIYIFNEHYTEMTAMMKAPSGQPVTQWDMNDADYMGCLKYDFLTIEALDKIRTEMDLLLEGDFIQDQGSLKATYDKYLHPDVLDYSEQMWKPSHIGQVIDLFQFETPVGGDAIKKVQPTTLEEAASANSLMRLMPLDDGTVPTDKFVEFKNNISLWYKEMEQAGLSKDEMKLIEPHYLPVFGVPNTQEDLMEILMNDKLIGFDIVGANWARKIVGKKQMEKIPELKAKIYESAESRGVSGMLIDYIYDTAIKPQLGYSFSRNHTTPYTCIALQELNLYSKFPSLYWATACLTVNAGANEVEDGKDRSTDYAKIAKAIGHIRNAGQNVSLIDINRSDFGFKPDLDSGEILFGLKGLVGVGDDVAHEIITNRPYVSLVDFMSKCPQSRGAMVSLIKAGAFDKLESKSRYEIMADYLLSTMTKRKAIDLRTVPTLAQAGLLAGAAPEWYTTYEFNRYLKAQCKKKDLYLLDDRAYDFFRNCFDEDVLTVNEDNIPAVPVKVWDKIYDKCMNPFREWIRERKETFIRKLDGATFQEEWDKYASGTVSRWEMDSLSFYHSVHELAEVDVERYGIAKFNERPSDPIVASTFKRNGRDIPIFELTMICGTVLGKNKTKGSIDLLTPEGEVVLVRFGNERFAQYDKQISEVNDEGKKTVIEKTWFQRGNKLLIRGFRRGDQFVPKKYASTGGHTCYLIKDVEDDGGLTIQGERAS